MIDTMRKWYDRYLTREDSVVLLMVIVSTFLSLWLLGDVLAPILIAIVIAYLCLLYTSPSPRDVEESRMPSSA